MEDDYSNESVSALDFHILRNAFRLSIAELSIPETKWADHAKAMVRELKGNIHVDLGLIAWIIRK